MKATPWFPKQHGAWAMLLVSFAAGLVLRLRLGMGLPPVVWLLLAVWVLGYLAFSVAAAWLKAAPARRARWTRPLVVYTSAAATTGIAALLLGGAELASWIPIYAVLLGTVFVLTATGRERSTVAGLLTTGAASLAIGVLTQPWAPELLGTGADARAALALIALMFAYQGGTVWHVKTNIRERGSSRFLAASILWHGLALLLAAGLALTGQASPAWVALFLLIWLRAIVIPRLRRPLAPARLGMIEVAFSLTALAIVALG